MNKDIPANGQQPFFRSTEAPSPHRHLEQRPVAELLTLINQEDQSVAPAVERSIPQIAAFAEAAAERMLKGGRLFYIGAGTSGRLGILDASECPPTYGVPPGLVVGIIAGGTEAIQNAVEGAEDDREQGWKDLEAYHISDLDVVLGIAASGTTPYVIAALAACRARGIATGSLCCNSGAPISREADFPIEVVVGPEVVTGSTRMKSGTAQKLVLNMISTTVMIRMGRVEDNKMVHMKLANDKLVDRGVQMLMERAGIRDYGEARDVLLRHGSVKKALESLAK
ncbi:N-acetylmuramic acid 6-phosphate etherase [Flaviaesturariibacter amylovorans]|uniref:N-acetylmuramic acid 6-phosphate etherase n=1 Tax=Flaviaesturariibacter amylovorans TaxID=1084520 RepID=A0ABP8GMM1_9BACT